MKGRHSALTLIVMVFTLMLFLFPLHEVNSKELSFINKEYYFKIDRELSITGKSKSGNKLPPAPEGKRTDKKYSWESSMAKATESGDLVWTPEPYIFEAGESLRFIDFDDGDDYNSGTSRSEAWKHHPWDPASKGKSAECTGIHTFVFKRGSIYRGGIIVKESGEQSNPVRFTSDPSWGSGEAALYGSIRITEGWTKGADHKDIPDPESVWYRDLDFMPRTLWMIDKETITRIPLARMPNWKISDPEDVKSEWWWWNFPTGKGFSYFMKNENGKELILGVDTTNLKGPKDLYMGAVVYTEYGWVDGTPYPSFVQGFDAEQKGIGFDGYLGSVRSRLIARYHRYYLEDKPHYLDDPDGEFWFDRKDSGGRLYLRLPEGKDPNTVILEAGKESTLIDISNKKHIKISGLVFRFTNNPWDLTELPWTRNMELKKHVFPSCVRVWGGGYDIQVSNCLFNHVNAAVYMRSVYPDLHLDKIAVTDCKILETDHGGITIQEGIQYGNPNGDEAGHLYDVKVLRNYVYKSGQRPMRAGPSNGIDVSNGETTEVAGNIVDTPWHAGVNVRGAKIGSNVRDVPLARILIYQNKVTDGIRSGDDCGNIETWQGGPAYIYNNVSGNPGGFRNNSWITGKDEISRPGSARFGMAYYLDGSFKNYFFNNIGYGLSKDPWSFVGATAMFQEIISYQNAFFNNTAYNFVKGSRRQAPHAGRNKFLGNIWDGIGDWVFWHTTPARSAAVGNEMDAGRQRDHYALETNAFSNNIFHDITGKYGSFKPSGQWNVSFEDSRETLKEVGAIAYDLGKVTTLSLMKDPLKRDFSLTETSAALDYGVKVFVPWSLYATVGEWNFYPAGNDPEIILDEHWYMAPYYNGRDDYYKLPMFDLKGVNITEKDYSDGPLEDWTKGTLNFNGVNQYAVCPDDSLNKSFSYIVNYRWDPEGKKETRQVTGKDFKSPQIYDSNFLIEAYFRADPGSSKAVLAEKMSGSGYSLVVDERGGITFTVKSGKKSAKVKSNVAVNDGRWHHVIAEADRNAKSLTIYINGVKNAEGKCIDEGYSLDNNADFYVGGTPKGRYLKGSFEFLRIGLGTLADSKTDIDELYAWQFYGPFLKDFTGNLPKGKRDAGALEKR